MKKYIYLSDAEQNSNGTYNYFNKKISDMLKNELTNAKNVVFVPAKTDENIVLKNSETYFNCLVNAGVKLESYETLLNINSPEECEKIIKNADIVFLLGGMPSIQKKFIEDKKISEAIFNKNIICGLSAGAMLMSDYALCIRFFEDMSKVEIVKGYRLYDVNIIPHFNFFSNIDRVKKDFKEVSSKYKNVVFMADDTALLIKQNKPYLINDNAYIYKSNKMQKVKIDKYN